MLSSSQPVTIVFKNWFKNQNFVCVLVYVAEISFAESFPLFSGLLLFFLVNFKYFEMKCVKLVLNSQKMKVWTLHRGGPLFLISEHLSHVLHGQLSGSSQYSYSTSLSITCQQITLVMSNQTYPSQMIYHWLARFHTLVEFDIILIHVQCTFVI